METAQHHLIECIRTAGQEGTRLRVHGGGSKQFFRPTAGAALLSTLGMQGVLSYEPSELVITVRSGTSLVDVQALLAQHGQCLPFDPPHFADAGALATVGGMVASGWSGPARACVGAVRDYVLGAALINGRGEWLHFGGQVMKNVAGYDVARLLCGSWGSLGVLTEVSLKVLPVAPGVVTLRWRDVPQDEALRRLNTWGGKPLPLHASTWLQENGVGCLYVRLSGARAAVEAACRSLGGERLSEQESNAFWQACREQQLAWFRERPAQQALWRLSMPATAPALALPDGVCAGPVEWQGAQRWVQAPESARAALAQLVRHAGGHLTRFRAAATASDTPTVQPAPTVESALARIQRQVQAAFDPHGIFVSGSDEVGR